MIPGLPWRRSQWPARREDKDLWTGIPLWPPPPPCQSPCRDRHLCPPHAIRSQVREHHREGEKSKWLLHVRDDQLRLPWSSSTQRIAQPRPAHPGRTMEADEHLREVDTQAMCSSAKESHRAQRCSRLECFSGWIQQWKRSRTILGIWKLGGRLRPDAWKRKPRDKWKKEKYKPGGWLWLHGLKCYECN